MKRDWLGFSEINRVVYQPAEISVKEMENALKKAGTYVRTVSEDEAGDK